MKSRLTTEHGAALFIALALILALSMIGIMTVDRATVDIELSYVQMNQERAFYVAEAGLEHGLAELKRDSLWRAGFMSESMGSGFYTVLVKDSLTDTGLADTIVLTSRALVNGAVAAMEAYIIPGPPFNIFKYAMFGGDSVTFDKASCTDSYNSDSGSYAATVDTTDGDIGSNGTITLEGGLGDGAEIYGDVTTSGDSIIIEGDASVSGDTATQEEEYPMNLIPPSEYIWAEANTSAPSGFSGSGYSYNPSTYDLTIGAFSDITLASGVYFFNNITLEQSALLKLAPGAEVTIYMTGNVDAGQDSKVNGDGDPTDLIFYSSGDSLTLSQSVEFRAAFYGPEASFSIAQNTNLYGAIVAKSVEMKLGSCIHYDRSLMEITKPIPGLISVVAWRQI